MNSHSWHLRSLAVFLVLMTAGVAAADAPAPPATAADPAQDSPADKKPTGESSDPLNDVAEPFVPLHPRSGREQDRVAHWPCLPLGASPNKNRIIPKPCAATSGRTAPTPRALPRCGKSCHWLSTSTARPKPSATR